MELKPRERKSTRVTPGGRFHEVRYPGQLSMPKHSHGPAYFTLVLSGGYEERIGSEVRHITGPAILFHPPEEDHAVQFAPVSTHIVGVEVSSELTRRAREAKLPVQRGVILHSSEALATGAKLVREFQRSAPYADFALDGLLMELLVQLGRPVRGRPECPSRSLRLATEFIEANACNLPSLDQIASVAGMHPVSLARSFKQSYGESITEFVRRRRFELAVRELHDGTLQLAEVAAKLGFADQAHFTREFRRVAGVTPGRFRKAYLKG